MFLSPGVKFVIKEHALKNPNNECCGFILDDGSVLNCINQSYEPQKSFLISKEEQKQAEQIGIAAVYHSHIWDDAFFTDLDKYISEKTNKISIIYHIKTDQFIEYKPCGYEIPFLGRAYIPGVFDCVELVRDYYQKALNITINPLIHEVRSIDFRKIFEYPELHLKYNNESNNELKQYFLDNGFGEVYNLEKNDVILTKGWGIKCPIHCSLYMNNNEILHHLAGAISAIDGYEDKYKKMTACYLRHASLLRN